SASDGSEEGRPLIAANSRARASTISDVTVPMPAAFSIMIPLFSGFFLIINQLPILIYLELRDEQLSEPRRDRCSRFNSSCTHQIQEQFRLRYVIARTRC